MEDVPYAAGPARGTLTPGAGPAPRAPHAAGWRLVVVSNQSGVAHGSFPESALVGLVSRMCELLGEFWVPLAGYFHCPHHPGGIISEYAVVCNCGKPAPGLILTTAARLEVDPRSC